jgi:hypothetical protein
MRVLNINFAAIHTSSSVRHIIKFADCIVIVVLDMDTLPVHTCCAPRVGATSTRGDGASRCGRRHDKERHAEDGQAGLVLPRVYQDKHSRGE